MIQPDSIHLNMTPAEIANFLGATAVALAEGYLRGEQPIEHVSLRLDNLCDAIADATRRAPTRRAAALFEPVRLLVLATIFAAEAGESRERWHKIVNEMIAYVRDEGRRQAVPA